MIEKEWYNLPEGGLRIVLAGAENPSALKALIKAKARFVLMSYFYLRKMSREKQLSILRLAKEAKMWILLDSGTHSFLHRFMWLDTRGMKAKISDEEKEAAHQLFIQETNGGGMEAAMKEMNAYMEEYVKWVKETEEFIDCFSELDIDPIVGLDKVKEWRKWWIEEGLVEKLIVTNHGDGSQAPDMFMKEEFDELLSGEFPFLGMEVISEVWPVANFFRHYEKQLRKYRIKVHGWAQTNIVSITQIPFYSVDSTTWLGGARWGLSWRTEPARVDGMLKTTPKELRQMDRADLEREGNIDYENLISDKMKPHPHGHGIVVNEFNAQAWVAFQREHFLKTNNAYWLTDGQKAKVVNIQVSDYRTKDAIVRHSADVTALDKIQDGRTPRRTPRFCNTCFIAGKCPRYAIDTTCSFMAELDFQPKSVKDLAFRIVSIEYDRLMHATMAERVQGGYIDPLVGAEIDRFIKMLNDVKNLFMPQLDEELLIKAKGGAGIISQIFGGFVKKSQKGKSQAPEARKFVKTEEGIEVELADNKVEDEPNGEDD